MPRGIPNKKKEEVMNEADQEAPKAESTSVPEVKPTVPAPVKPKVDPLAPGQAYFEAPDGTIIIGEDSKNEVWCRALNNGKGGWINKKR